MGRQYTGAGRRRVIVLAAALLASTAHADEPVNLEFVNAPIADILVTLGLSAGRSIVADESVTGRASWYFHNVRFEEALAAFAARFDLFVDTEDGIHTVSAVRVETDADGLLSVAAPGVAPALLVRRLSEQAGIPIVFERPPDREVDFFTERVTLPQALAQLATAFPDHRLDERDGAWVFARVDPTGPLAGGPVRVRHDAGQVSIDAPAGTLGAVAQALFEGSGREYQLLARRETPTPPIRFERRPFDEILTLVVEQADAAWTRVDDLYYITPADPRSAAARTRATVVKEVEHLPVATLLELLPPESTVDVTVRADRAGGRLTVTGAAAAVDRVVALIDRLDAPAADRDYRRFDLRTLGVNAFAPLLPLHLRTIDLVEIPSSSSFLALVTEAQAEGLADFVAAVDRPLASTLVELEHITVDRLLANLPPSVRAEQIVPTGDNHRFFYRGGDDGLAGLREELAHIDVPLPQIRYHLLVIQYENGDGFEFEFDLGNSLTTPDSEQAFLGRMGNLLALEFDIVSTLGYQFAARLNAGLTDATAAIVADTTLSALSGRPVSFRNTSTYRYRDSAGGDAGADADARTAVVREITSGLTLEITGEVRGDFVVMDVAATVSRRGSDGSENGNPPTTSEKLVRTYVRARPGSPVILSGLRHSEEDRSIRETPLLGQIPLLGWLFASRRENRDESELAIYIVPQIDRIESFDGLDAELMTIYERHFGSTR